MMTVGQVRRLQELRAMQERGESLSDREEDDLSDLEDRASQARWEEDPYAEEKRRRQNVIDYKNSEIKEGQKDLDKAAKYQEEYLKAEDPETYVGQSVPTPMSAKKASLDKYKREVLKPFKSQGYEKAMAEAREEGRFNITPKSWVPGLQKEEVAKMSPQQKRKEILRIEDEIKNNVDSYESSEFNRKAYDLKSDRYGFMKNPHALTELDTRSGYEDEYLYRPEPFKKLRDSLNNPMNQRELDLVLPMPKGYRPKK